jgi:hypothetical protein
MFPYIVIYQRYIKKSAFKDTYRLDTACIKIVISFNIYEIEEYLEQAG